ncbi:calcium and integrin binding family member 2 [Salpingoeca rosetta]|uniref:Calcium and integrin binding family member 2 n=1 Tax=Salpingoeca rosetta (strain ATCC 50818 / BSB-021) TaxID=946362 RepID=F2TWL8_SALR5|nr:calcium and integrin binding family member 2 [Salpingoeca rosetta]EGD72464.1 calcium and integrin binding family member 2 [Salpingoeca rosetta]|eukprot:XP_004999033.1 calcium and integrin binding family member 2 [Salpingoeca rosetta]
MGGVQSELLHKNLEKYQAATFLSRSEIIHIHRLYLKHGGQDDEESRLSWQNVVRIPQLDQNPFKKRICHVFSEDSSGNLTFLEFLEMFSVFHESAPLGTKIHHAFRIYDFNDDGKIDAADLFEVVSRLCGRKDDNEECFADDAPLSDLDEAQVHAEEGEVQARSVITPGQVEEIVKKTIKQADLDGDACISYYEFYSVVARSHTFLDSFRIWFN